eukprot:685636-Pyramimonas_sp.AAC.1
MGGYQARCRAGVAPGRLRGALYCGSPRLCFKCCACGSLPSDVVPLALLLAVELILVNVVGVAAQGGSWSRRSCRIA